MKNKAHIVIIALVAVSIQSCFLKHSIEPISETDYILHETFSYNRIGWIEENTGAHTLDINNGYYYIYNHDSISIRTSSAPLNKLYLCDIGSRYEVFTEIKVMNKVDDSNFGLLLYSGSLEYQFNVDVDGLVEVHEYDFNSEELYRLISDSITIRENITTSDSTYLLYMLVDYPSFEFYINNHLIGSSEFSAEKWMDLRLYAGKNTKVRIDYLNIR